MNIQKRFIYFLKIAIPIILLTACTTTTEIFKQNSSEFQLNNSCIDLSKTDDITFEGTIWYNEGDILDDEYSGLHWAQNSSDDTGTLPLSIASTLISPNRSGFLSLGNIVNTDIRDLAIYYVEGPSYKKTNIENLYRSPIWTEDDTVLGIDWDYEEDRISTINTNIKTGEAIQNDYFFPYMSSEPQVQVARNGILTYLWYTNYEGPRLIVYDTIKDKEIARYENIAYQIRPSWSGYLLNSEGTHILAISSLSGEGYTGKQQELFGVAIGEEKPVQLTDFHSIYPYTLIYNLNYGGERWSPDNHWVLIELITSDTNEFDLNSAPNHLFLIDLQKNIAYKICEQLTGKNHRVVWSPDSNQFALSIEDKIWIVDPKTLESHLLIERPGIPLDVLGWTSQ